VTPQTAQGNPFEHKPVSYEQPYRPLAISHRGCMFESPENTLSAFAWAGRVGADAIELDLRATADGEIVVIHDKTVNRTTNGSGAIRSLTLEEVRRLDAGAGQKVPTMDEAFAFARAHELRLLLDVKDTKRVAPETVYEALERHDMTDQVIIGARSVEQLRAFKALDPDLYSMAFTKRTSLIDDYVAAGVDVVRLWARWVQQQPELVARVQKLGPRVWVTTGALRGEPLNRILRLGVQGVITDHPEDILNLQPLIDLPPEIAAAD
jgi:glycerophosphoryl diester phosphodiesterase